MPDPESDQCQNVQAFVQVWEAEGRVNAERERTSPLHSFQDSCCLPMSDLLLPYDSPAESALTIVEAVKKRISSLNLSNSDLASIPGW